MKAHQYISTLLLTTSLVLFNNIPIHALGTTWYVSTTGSNSNNCLSEVAACRTIQWAIDKASNSDTVNIAAGMYNESISIDKSLTVIGADANTTIINAAGNAYGIAVYGWGQTVATTISDLAVTGASSSQDAPFGVIIFNDLLILNRVRVYNNEGIGIGNSVGTLKVYNSLIYGNQSNGLHSYGDGKATLINNTIVDNLGPGVSQYGSDAQLIAYNNIIDGNTEGLGIMFTFQNVPSTILNNLNNDGYQFVANIDPSNIMGDPGFINRPVQNYHISQTSIAINGGTYIADAPSLDYDKDARFQFGFVDIGADESSFSTPDTFSCQYVSEILTSECEALVTLYNDTNGSNWTNHANWLQSNSPCSWYGVNCSGNEIYSIMLDSNNLVGTIPSELGSISSLAYLYLHNNQLTGSIPPEFSTLPQLIGLNLQHNQLSGSIPAELGDLSNLALLYLNDNQLLGNIPPELSSLNKLEWLMLYNNQLTGSIPAELGSLSALERLALDHNQLSGGIPLQLGNLTQLSYLTLNHNKLSGNIPVELGNLTGLWGLTLNNNLLTGNIPAQLGNLPLLNTLTLQVNQLTGSIPPQLGSLSELVTFYLYSNQLTGSIPPELGSLSKLRWLSLRNNQLSGSIPSSLGSLSNLYYLSLSTNQLSGNIPPELGNLSNLDALYLYTNQLSGSIPPELGNLSQLDWLSLCENQLSGSIPASLGSLSQLQMLDICMNQLTGSIPPEIINLSQLAILDVSANQLTGNLPNNIGNLTNLEYLATRDNLLSGAIPASIVNLVNLYYIDVSCDLTTTDPSVIAFLNDKNPYWSSNCVNPAPKVLSIVRANPNPANATSANFTVTFSESVTGVNINALSDFSLVTTGVTGASISGISGSGITRTVTVNTGSGSGTIRLDVLDNDSIIDSASNPLGGVGLGNGGFTSGETYTIDKTTPSIVSSVRADLNPTKAASVNFTVIFSESVTGVASDDFSLLTSGSVSGAAVSGVNGLGSIYTVTVSTGSGNGTIKLNVIDDDTIVNIISKPLGGPGMGNGSFTNGETYDVDRTTPIISSITRASSNPTASPLINFLVTFSESVIGVDTSDFVLNTSSVAGATVSSVSGSGTTRTVKVNTGSGDGTIRLDALDNDTIADLAGNSLNGGFTSGEVYTVDKPNLPAPNLRSLRNSAITKDTTPTLWWTSVKGGATYEIEVASNITFIPIIDSDSVSGLSHTVASPLSDNDYFWRVRAINASNQPGAWSSTRTFTIDTTGPSAPALNSPANNFSSNRTPTFKWLSVPAAVLYEFQYDDNLGFVDPTYTVTVRGTFRRLPAMGLGTYYWHVRAKDATGNWGDWSAPNMITITSP